MKGEDWDFADVRQILRAIRVARPEAAVGVISSRLPELLPLVKDVVLVLLSAKHEDVKVEGLKPRFGADRSLLLRPMKFR
jgi:hypothetical protein